MLTRSRAVVLAVAALSLGACANVHPGSAAVVDGESISMRTLDDTAVAYCTLTADSAKQQGIQSVDNADVRRQAIVGLVSVAVARDVAEREDLTIEPSAYELDAQQRQSLESAFPDGDVDALQQAIQDSREVSAIATALAVKQTGEQPTPENEAQLAEMGQNTILGAFADSDVKFAPRFGLSPSGEQRADTGSLSVASVDLEAPTAEDLPVTQRCS